MIDSIKKGEFDRLGPIEKYATASTAWLLNDPVTVAGLAQRRVSAVASERGDPWAFLMSFSF
jgi:hypothetical protein